MASAFCWDEFVETAMQISSKGTETNAKARAAPDKYWSVVVRRVLSTAIWFSAFVFSWWLMFTHTLDGLTISERRPPPPCTFLGIERGEPPAPPSGWSGAKL